MCDYFNWNIYEFFSALFKQLIKFWVLREPDLEKRKRFLEEQTLKLRCVFVAGRWRKQNWPGKLEDHTVQSQQTWYLSPAQKYYSDVRTSLKAKSWGEMSLREQLAECFRCPHCSWDDWKHNALNSCWTGYLGSGGSKVHSEQAPSSPSAKYSATKVQKWSDRRDVHPSGLPSSCSI